MRNQKSGDNLKEKQIHLKQNGIFKKTKRKFTENNIVRKLKPYQESWKKFENETVDVNRDDEHEMNFSIDKVPNKKVAAKLIKFTGLRALGEANTGKKIEQQDKKEINHTKQNKMNKTKKNQISGFIPLDVAKEKLNETLKTQSVDSDSPVISNEEMVDAIGHKLPKKNGKKMKNRESEKKTSKPGAKAKNKRFVLFVGNLPYSATKEHLDDHFKESCNIQDIRLALDATNASKGYAFIELKDEESYQKALCKNHSFLNNRRINVVYTKPGKKDSVSRKKDIKKKTLKLEAMVRKGMFAGSTKDTNKRSFRRAKKHKGDNFRLIF